VFVDPTERIREVVADPENDKFLECAAAAGAEAIVSGAGIFSTWVSLEAF
jgi:predicted nucleic acid-binding protein